MSENKKTGRGYYWLGKQGYWHGKKLPASMKKNISKGLKRAYKEGRLISPTKGKHLSPSHKAKLDKIMTQWWRDHPNVRKQKSQEMKKYYAEHPEAWKKFLSGGRNFNELKQKTKFKFKVRSKGEQQIANFLYDRKIKASYESSALKLDAWICVPDFYLPRYNVFIEYYGGHPKSWKKKVEKNKLYKKYKIPCIFITPAELRNLPRYLIKDAVRVAKGLGKSMNWRKYKI
ncbi:MAG: hypothetical protein ABIH72_04600 [archaeon]